MAEIEIGTKKPRELVSDVEVNLTGREARILYDMLNDAITVRGSIKPNKASYQQCFRPEFQKAASGIFDLFIKLDEKFRANEETA